MKIGVPAEIDGLESRVAATPETVYIVSGDGSLYGFNTMGRNARGPSELVPSENRSTKASSA